MKKQEELLNAYHVAHDNITSKESVLDGGCTTCGCELFVCYQYEDGQPVPNAECVVTTLSQNKLQGKTDSDGLFKIKNIDCGCVDMLFSEGSDCFTPPQREADNPVLTNTPELAALASEYFTLSVLTLYQGTHHEVTHQAQGSTCDEVKRWDSDDQQAIAERFHSLKEECSDPLCDKEKSMAINRMLSSLPAELNHLCQQNVPLSLFCQMMLCLAPVMTHVRDHYRLGEWMRHKHFGDDPVVCKRAILLIIGFMPEFGESVKMSGEVIVQVLMLNNGENNVPRTQQAIQILRSLSNGNLVNYLTQMRSQLPTYSIKIRQYLADLQQGGLTLAPYLKNSVKEDIDQLCESVQTLLNKVDETIQLLQQDVTAFLPLIVTQVTATARKSGDTSPQIILAKRCSQTIEDGLATLEGRTVENEEMASNTNIEMCVGDPVNIVTGALTETRTDFVIDSVMPLAHSRYYRSVSQPSDGLIGRVWRSSWDRCLILSKGKVIFCDYDYSQAIFAIPGDSTESRSQLQPQWILKREMGQLVLCHRDGSRYYFNHAEGSVLRLSAVQHRQGYRITFEYWLGMLQRVRLADDRVIEVESEDHRITRLSLHNAENEYLQTLATYRYDEYGRLIQVRGQAGKNFDYHYNKQGYLCRWQDLISTWVTYQFDEKGRVVNTRGAEGYWQGSMCYDDERHVSSYTNTFGGTEHYYYDDKQRIIAYQDVDGQRTEYDWDRYDNLRIKRDDHGETHYQYNEFGEVTEVTLPDGNRVQFEYDSFGLLRCFTNPFGYQWRYHYDENGNLLEEINAEKQRKSYVYDQQNRLSELYLPNGEHISTRYNRYGLLTDYQSSADVLIQFHYDRLNRLISETANVAGELHHCYWFYRDEQVKPYKVEDDSGNQLHFDYDLEGNVVKMSDALGQKTCYEYGAFDTLIKMTSPDGTDMRFHYHGEGGFAGVTNSQGQHWVYQFDHAGRVVKERHYDGHCTQYAYDQYGRLVKQTKADASAVCYFYDSRERLSHVHAIQADGNIEQEVQFAYDALGRIVQARNDAALVTYRYNGVGKVVEETINGETLISHYDESGQRVRLEGAVAAVTQQWQSGQLTSLAVAHYSPLYFEYDALGYEAVRYNDKGFALLRDWGMNGRLLQQRDAHRHLTCRYDYDPLNRLKRVDDSEWGRTEYEFTPQGQIAQAQYINQQGHINTHQFAYDSELHLKKIGYLHGDHQQQREYLYDKGARVVQRDSIYCQYDVCGRLIEKHVKIWGESDQVTTYQWDIFDRLRQIRLPDGECWQYDYDSFGRRIDKTCLQSGDSSANSLHQAVSKEHFLWDGPYLVARSRVFDDGKTTTTQWIYEPNHFRPLAQLTTASNGRTHLYHIITDQDGTPRALSDEQGELRYQSQQPLWERFQERGVQYHTRMEQEDPLYEPIRCELRYQGQIEDSESGLYYNRYRFYDIELGQYLSPDPVGLLGGWHPQSYVSNPLDYIDPMGLVKCENKFKNLTKVNGVLMCRKDINLSGDDKYGHWWTEIGFSESYGWWPSKPVGLSETLLGVPGELNGQSVFWGSPTQDPHHRDRSGTVKVYEVYIKDDRDDESVYEQIRHFASTYKGQWSWPKGPNCHTFQEEMIRKFKFKLKKQGKVKFKKYRPPAYDSISI